MISDYKVVKDAGSLRQRLGLRPVSYLEDEIEPGLAAFIDEAKVKQRSGRLHITREAFGQLDSSQLL